MCSIWRKTTINGWMDCEWKCDIEYVSIGKQNAPLQVQKSSRHHSSLHRGLMKGGGYGLTDFNYIHLWCVWVPRFCRIGVKAKHRLWRMGGEGGCCHMRKIGIFFFYNSDGAEGPVDLFYISPSTWEWSWKRDPVLLGYCSQRTLLITSICLSVRLLLSFIINWNSVKFSFMLY